jgi:hypothetical protein
VHTPTPLPPRRLGPWAPGGRAWTPAAVRCRRAHPRSEGGLQAPRSRSILESIGFPRAKSDGERRMREACPCVPPWHKSSVLSPEICDTLIPGNSRIALPLFGGVLCHTGREVSDHVATDDQHPMARKMTATHVCAAACLDSTIRVEAMGGQSTQVSQRGTTGRPGQTDSAAHTRWARQAQPSVGSMPCDRQGHRRHASRVSKRFSAIMRSRRALDHPHAGVPCPAPLPRACTATHW